MEKRWAQIRPVVPAPCLSTGNRRSLMENADAVKLAADLYFNRGSTQWPLGRPPYTA